MSPLQDALIANKARRLRSAGQMKSLAWQLAGEAFLLYLANSNGVPLDTYLAGISEDLVMDLEKVGIAPLDPSSVRELCSIADDVRRCIPEPR